MARTKSGIHVLYLGEIKCSPRTSQRHEIKPSNYLGHSVEFHRLLPKELKHFWREPEASYPFSSTSKAFDARRSVAKARTRRSTHPQRAIRVREIAAPARTRNQRFKHSLRRSDRPTNSRPSFPKAEVKPRPAPNIRSRSSPAGCAAASSNPNPAGTRPATPYDQPFRRHRPTPFNRDIVPEVPYPAEAPFDRQRLLRQRKPSPYTHCINEFSIQYPFYCRSINTTTKPN